MIRSPTSKDSYEKTLKRQEKQALKSLSLPECEAADSFLSIKEIVKVGSKNTSLCLKPLWTSSPVDLCQSMTAPSWLTILCYSSNLAIFKMVVWSKPLKLPLPCAFQPFNASRSSEMTMEPPLLAVLHSSKVLICRKDLPVQHRPFCSHSVRHFIQRKLPALSGLGKWSLWSSRGNTAWRSWDGLPASQTSLWGFQNFRISGLL